MSNPTTPFGWQMPTNTDLVTDLPADFEVFGQAVATSMADLLGGTTGQVLAKNTNADMDFVWITNDVGDITEVTAGTGISGGGTSGAVTITNSMATAIDAKGDLIVGTAADTFSRLAVGATNGHVLTVDSAEATGLKYAAVASGGMTLLSTTTLSGTTTTISSISGAYNNLMIFVRGVTFSANACLRIRPNSVTANMQGWYFDTPSQDEIRARVGATTYAGSTQSNYVLQIFNYTNTTSMKPCLFTGVVTNTNNMTNIGGTIDTTSAITSLVISTVAGTSTFTAGTVEIYGVK